MNEFLCSRPTAVLACLVVFALAVVPTWAVDYTGGGSDPTDWADNANWGGGDPTGDTTNINGTYNVTVDNDTVRSLRLGNGAVVTIPAGVTLTATSEPSGVGWFSSAGAVSTLNIEGTFDASSHNNNLWLGDSAGSPAVLNVYGNAVVHVGGALLAARSSCTLSVSENASINVPNDSILLPYYDFGAGTLAATFEMTGGTITTGGSFGFAGNSTFTASMSDGTIDCVSLSHTTGTFEFSGGSIILDGNQVGFNAANSWFIVTGARAGEYTETYSGGRTTLNIPPVPVVGTATALDNPMDVAEGDPEGTAVQFSVVLDSEPNAPVTVTATPPMIDLTLNGLDPNVSVNLIFTTGNWDVPQTVTVKAFDDEIDESDREVLKVNFLVSSSDTNFDPGQIYPVRVSVVDNDPVIWVATTESEDFTYVEEDPRHFGSTTDSFTVHLDKPPGAEVTVTVTPSVNGGDIDLGLGPGQPVNLIFTPVTAHIPQPVTVTAVQDGVQEVRETATIDFHVSSSDPNYHNRSVAPLEVLVIDVHWEMDEFLISVWNENTDVYPERAQAWADANFTAIFCLGTQEHLDVLQAAGIKGLFQGVFTIQDAEAFTNHSALWGYFLADEPHPEDYLWWGEQVKAFHRTDPKHPSMLDPLPMGAGLRDFMDKVDPEFCPGGIYPWQGGNPRSNHFPWLEDYYDLYQTYGVPLTMWTGAQAGNFDDPAACPPDNNEKIRYDCYSSIAYGVKGIHWFVLDVILGPDNQLYPAGEDVAEVNGELKNLGPWLVQLESVNVYHTAPLPSSTRQVPADHWVQLDTNDIVLGMFKDPNMNDYMFITNRSITTTPTVQVEFRQEVPGVQKLNKATGEWETLTVDDSGQYQTVDLPLGKGDGELLRIAQVSRADFNGDGDVDLLDLMAFVSWWMECTFPGEPGCQNRN